MTVVEGLLTVALLLVAAQSVPLQDEGAPTEERQEWYRLPTHVVPVHYDIRLIPYFLENNFAHDGETSIDIKVRRPTDAVVLHAKRLTIDETRTRLTRKDGNDVNAASDYAPKRHDYDERLGTLTVRFEEPLEPGIYTLYFKFVGVIELESHGFYTSLRVDNDGNNVPLAVTHFQPAYARQTFPCWDELSRKATFKFSVKHHPNYTALSNMPSTRSEIDTADGRVWTYFETTPVMSTHVLGFVIVDYDHVSNLDGTIRIWCPRHLLPFTAYALDIAERATRELERFANSTYRMPKMDHVTDPNYSSRATENWGMIVYKENVLLRDENAPFRSFFSPIEEKIYNTMTITHELAHQWFGNLVTPAWWSYFWLSEGISTYLKFYITDKFLDKWRLMDFFVIDHVKTIFTIDSFKENGPINADIMLNFSDAYSPNTYRKSAILLRMVSHFVREDVFRNGLIKYLRAHEYSSATPDDLWKALQDALDESDVPHDDFKVKEVMDTWFEQGGYPLVTVNRDYATGEIRVTQKTFRSEESNDTEKNSAAWWIPLNYATQSNLDFSSTLATHWLRPQDESITIEGVDINDWIIVNKQLTGYYRVNYDTTNWKRIAEFLNSDNYAKIPVLTRGQIIADAYVLTEAEQLDRVTFFEIINYLSREIDPAAWYPAFPVIEKLNTYLQIPEGAVIIKPYIYNLTRRLFEHIGLDEHLDDDVFVEKAREKLGDYVCTYEHPECQAKATAKVLAYIEDPIANKISPHLEWIFCVGLMKVNESVWSQFLQAETETLNNRLYYLGCTEKWNILMQHINYITTTRNLTFPKNRYFDHIFSNVLKSPSNVDIAIDSFINNYDKISKHFQYGGYVIDNFIQNSVREDQIEKIKAFADLHLIQIDNQLTDREQMITKLNNNLSKIRGVLENNRFSVGTHIPLNNNTS